MPRESVACRVGGRASASIWGPEGAAEGAGVLATEKDKLCGTEIIYLMKKEKRQGVTSLIRQEGEGTPRFSGKPLHLRQF